MVTICVPLGRGPQTAVWVGGGRRGAYPQARGIRSVSFGAREGIVPARHKGASRGRICFKTTTTCRQSPRFFLLSTRTVQEAISPSERSVDLTAFPDGAMPSAHSCDHCLVQDAISLRERWVSLAENPSAVEWLFAVDADDSESIARLGRDDLAGTKVVVVPIGSLYHSGGSCVSGWILCLSCCSADSRDALNSRP